MAQTLAANTDLATLFGIELDTDTGSDAPVHTAATLCAKCRGKGKFYSYTGRAVGPCFACNGTGLAPTVGIEIKEGDCLRCCGRGEWRPGRSCFACDGTGKAVAAREAQISVEAIATAFQAAHGAGIKRPKLRLDTFVFSRAPDHGKNAGSIYVTERGDYLGKVSEGQFFPMRSCDDPTKARVIAAAADPSAAAKAYGAKTGECSCCGRELSNAESIELGIGPICRGKFGWGG